jgi:polysaccharide export outer membrane protein
MTIIIRALICLSLSVACGLAAAQPSMREVIGPGDTVRITAFRYPDLTTVARLTEDGKVGVPMLGPVKIAGMTPEQAADDIAARLKAGHYLLNPQIAVAVLQARSRQVSVLGFVNHPGRYVLEGSSARITDVIAMAGGLRPAAADTAVVQRDDGGKSETLHVDLASLIQGNNAAKNIELRSGDSVFVPEAPVIYVYGEVNKGGRFRLEPGMTVMQAISVAGGVTPRGSERRAKLRRRGADGKWHESDAKPFDTVRPNDVIYVRESIF